VAATVTDAAGSGLWMPFALLFFVRAQGMPLVAAGAALSAGGLIGLSLVPLAGTLADMLSLTPLLVACNVIRFAGFCCYPLATRWQEVMVIAAVIAFGDRLFWTANTPAVAALAPGRAAEQLIGTQTIARFAGAGLGSGAAALLPALSGGGLYRLLAYLNAASFAVAAVLIIMMGTAAPARRPGRSRRSDSGRPPRPDSWAGLARYPRYAGLCATHVLFTMASYGKYSMLAIVIVTVLHGPRWIPGAAVATGTIVIVAGQRPVTSYFASRSRAAALMLAAGIFTVAFASLSLLTVTPAAVTAVLILCYSAAVALAEAIFAPVALAAAAAAAPAALQGRASALFQLSWGISQVTSPLLLTALLSHGNPTLWLTLSGLTAIAVPLAWLQRGLLTSTQTGTTSARET
jgi:MFS family permease